MLDAATPLDLFAAASTVVEKIDMASALPSPSWQWDLLLTRLPHDAPVLVHISRAWVQVVVEQLHDPQLGRRILWRTGNITRYPASAGLRSYRVIYMTADGARDLHRRMPLIDAERGETYVRLRVARAGEVGPMTMLGQEALEMTP
ncbi:MAG: hypothetical protein WDN25_13120 [Acetobacteraceae bacterium]